MSSVMCQVNIITIIHLLVRYSKIFTYKNHSVTGKQYRIQTDSCIVLKYSNQKKLSFLYISPVLASTIYKHSIPPPVLNFLILQLLIYSYKATTLTSLQLYYSGLCEKQKTNIEVHWFHLGFFINFYGEQFTVLFLEII